MPKNKERTAQRVPEIRDTGTLLLYLRIVPLCYPPHNCVSRHPLYSGLHVVGYSDQCRRNWAEGGTSGSIGWAVCDSIHYARTNARCTRQPFILPVGGCHTRKNQISYASKHKIGAVDTTDTTSRERDRQTLVQTRQATAVKTAVPSFAVLRWVPLLRQVRVSCSHRVFLIARPHDSSGSVEAGRTLVQIIYGI